MLFFTPSKNKHLLTEISCVHDRNYSFIQSDAIFKNTYGLVLLGHTLSKSQICSYVYKGIMNCSDNIYEDGDQFNSIQLLIFMTDKPRL